MDKKTPLDRAIEKLAIRDVYLGDLRSVLKEGFDPKYEPQDMSLQTRYVPMPSGRKVELTHLENGEQLHMLQFPVTTGVRLITKSDDQSETIVWAEIEATFVAEYLMVDATELAEDEIAAFTSKNVMYHIWPYWRELIQSLSTRFRLPTIVLPMHSVRNAKAPAVIEDSPE